MTDEEKEKFKEILGSGEGMIMFPFLLLSMFISKKDLDEIFDDIKKKIKEGKEKPDEQVKNMSGFFFEE